MKIVKKEEGQGRNAVSPWAKEKVLFSLTTQNSALPEKEAI